MLDAVLDYYVFSNAPFLELLISTIPAHEFYMRLVISASFIGFGIAVALIMGRLEELKESLILSEQRFRQMAENINEVLWMSDVGKNGLLYISPRCETIFGIDARELYVAPERLDDMIHPADRHYIHAAMPKKVTGEYHEEFRIVHPDGRVRWLRDRSFPVRDGQDRIYRIVGITEDITERKQAEEDREHYLKGMNLLIHTSLQLLAEQSMEAVLQRAVEAAKDLTRTNLSLAGHRFNNGKFMVCTSTQAEEGSRSPAVQCYGVDQGQCLVDLVQEADSIRLDERTSMQPCLLVGTPPGTSGFSGGARCTSDRHKRRGKRPDYGQWQGTGGFYQRGGGLA